MMYRIDEGRNGQAKIIDDIGQQPDFLIMSTNQQVSTPRNNRQWENIGENENLNQKLSF